MNSAVSSPFLPVLSCQARFAVDGVPRLPVFPGSAWHGVFGHSLKRGLRRAPHRVRCLPAVPQLCFPYLFETPPPPDAAKMWRYSSVPHPYALRIESCQTDASYRLGA